MAQSAQVDLDAPPGSVCTCVHGPFGQHAALVQHRDACARWSARTPCRARPPPRECLPASAGQQLGGALGLLRRSCRPPARRPAAGCGSCISSMPISSHCFWPWDRARRRGARRASCRPMVSSTSSMRSRSAPVEARTRGAPARRLSPASASSRFSNTVWLLEHGRLLELAADAQAGDLGLVEAQSGRCVWPKKTLAAVRPGLAGDDVHHGGLAGAVGADDAAQLAVVDAAGCSPFDGLEAVEADA